MNIQTGDKVAYSVQFLRSIGMSHGFMAFARGEVKEVKSYSAGFALATIKWNDPQIPDRVNVANLAIVGANRRFCNID
jgi:hypothetical protein